MICDIHRSRLHHFAIVAGLLTVAMLSRFADAYQVTDLSKDQRLASIQSLLDFCAGPADIQHPISVEFAEVREPWATRSEIQAELRRISDRPDHPKRSILMFQLSMHDQPETECFYAVSPDGDWMLKRAEVRYAQSGDLRWISSRPEGGQLSIIKAGVPYPSGFDAGPVKQDLIDHHRRLFHAGFSDRITAYEINALSLSVTQWSVRISVTDPARSETALVEGGWAGESPVITSVRSESDETPVLFEQIEFASHEPGDVHSPFPYAKRSRRKQDLTRSTIVIIAEAVESPSSDELEAYAAVPDLGSADAVRDFREPRSASHDLYADSALTTWTRVKGTDEYETSRLESGNVYSEESVAKARRGFWWAAIALVATVLIAGAFLRIRGR